MKIEIKVPSVGESIKEAVLVQWFKKNGDIVRKDEPLFLIETDKVTLEVAAEKDGLLQISVPEGETVAIGAVVGTIDTAAPAAKEQKKAPSPKTKKIAEPSKEATDEPAEKPATELKPPEKPEAPVITPSPAADDTETIQSLAPSVRRLVAEKNVDLAQINGTGPGGRVTKSDVLLYLENTGALSSEKPPDTITPTKTPPPRAQTPAAKRTSAEQKISRKPMSPIRQRIAARLLEAKQGTAMLTTFNEIDMSRVQQIRSVLKEPFREKHGVSLGMMSFFIKATIEALKDFPEINAAIDDKDILYHHYYHIGIAVGSERGLVVPVIRDADMLGFAELEAAIVNFVKKINENRLELADLEGGTFTISNGGVYGSLLSTPILNTPQSGILGMHKIEDRPMVIDGKVAIRPMMYVALSYDHRIVDGREAVTFLKRIKECVENPELIMMEI
jgi:2-oxoglutarate dehydrogenase E2 component (dihydrolipoamide succinyltransferase)